MTFNNQFTVKASEAKLHFGEMLNECLYGGKEVIIEKHAKPVAVMVSIKKWQEKQSGETIPPLWLEIEKIKESIKKKQIKHKIKTKKTAVDYVRQIRDAS